MPIDAIGNIVTTGVSAAVTAGPDLSTGDSGQPVTQPQPNDQQQLAPQDATVTTLSDEALAQQAAADQAARDAAAAATTTATVTSIIASDWSAGTPAVDNATVQEALNALDEASRENLRADALATQQAQDDLKQKTIDAAAASAAQQQDDVVLAAINAGIRLAYGAVASPITGDPALREPGKVEIVA